MDHDEAEKEWPQKLIRVKNRVNGFHFPELHMRDISLRSIYLLLAEFSVRTVNYGPSFFPSIYGPRFASLRWKKLGP